MKAATRAIVMSGLMTLALTTIIPTTVLAGDKPEAEFSTGVYSQYVWRGFAFSDSSVVIQPSMSVAYNGIGVNIWGNLDTDLVGADSKDWSETDLTVSYDGSMGKIGYGVGWIYYNVDGTAADTQELYASVSYDTLLAPTLTVYTDVDANTGAYYMTLGVSHSITLGKDMSLDLGAQVGYLDDSNDYAELHDGLVSASMSFPVTEYLTITPELYYSFALSSDAEDAIMMGSADGDDSHIYGGVSASFAF